MCTNWEKNKPLISVILPFYNASEYLEASILSILAQTYSNFEFILLDDGSTDNGLDIASKYASRDSRIKIYHHPNMGLTKTLQKGCKLATGKYLARMDGDDVASPNRFQLQIEYLEQHPECVVLGTAITVIDPEGDKLCNPSITLEHKQIVQELLNWHGSRLCHPTVMMRTSIVKSIGGYIQEYHFEDVDLFLRLSKYGKLANLPNRLLQYRWHVDSISHTRQASRISKIRQQIIDRATSELDLHINLKAQDQSFLNCETNSKQDLVSTRQDLEYESFCRWCITARDSGYYKTSLKYLVRLLKKRPIAIKSYWALIIFALGNSKGFVVWNMLLLYKQRVLWSQKLLNTKIRS